MTGLASVILSTAKNLNFCRVLARKVQTDPLPAGTVGCLTPGAMIPFSHCGPNRSKGARIVGSLNLFPLPARSASVGSAISGLKALSP